MDTNDQPEHSQGEIILYRTDDGRTEVQLRAFDDNVWLTQNQIAELFNTCKQSINRHIKNIYIDGELLPRSVVNNSLTTAADGKEGEVSRNT